MSMLDRDILAAELSVIGACLIGGKKCLCGLSLKPDHFSAPLWADAFQIMQEMSVGADEFDPRQVAVRLAAMGHANSADNLMEAMTYTPTAAMAPANADLVRSAAKSRAARDIATRLALDYVSPVTVDDDIASVVSDLSALLRDEHRGGFVPFHDLLQQTIDACERPPEKRIYKLGLTQCDRMLQGIRPSDYVIIAARPAVGKSAFAGQIAVDMARAGAKVGLYSLEMTGQQIAERMLARAGIMPLTKLRSRHEDPNDWVDANNVGYAYDALKHLDIRLSSAVNITPSRVYHDMAGSDMDLVIIDHIGLMRADRKAENRTNEVGQVSRDLRMAAMNTGIPIIVLCQLNRAVEARADKKPSLADLRDSGSLEQDATAVIALSPHGDEESSHVLLEILKNRQGETGKTVMWFDKQHMRFLAADYWHEEPRKRRSAL